MTIVSLASHGERPGDAQNFLSILAELDGLDDFADSSALRTGRGASRGADFGARGGGGVKNLGSVMVAYMIGWGVFFIYLVTVARRTADVRKDVERLKQSLTRGK